MTAETIRVGVIGTGALGRHHARLYRQCEGVELVGVYDRDPEAARRVAEEAGTQVFESDSELARAVDGLSVAVPTDRHYEVVAALLALDRHVLVEKPIAATVAEARRLVAAAARRGLVLEVGHVERFNPVLDTLHQVPGAPRFIEAHRLAPYPPPRPGLRPRGTEVSVVLDLMIHDIDVVLDLVRSRPKRVDAVGVPVLSPSEDIANARILFENGCIANMTASRVSPEPMRKIRVFKPRAYLSLDYQEKKGEIAALGPAGIVRQPVPVRAANALLEELRDFCRCVRQAKATGAVPEPRVSGRQGLTALRLAERILRRIHAAAPKTEGPDAS
ncbi:MAG: Gfo/Idh/MocA family oxidoreductase [Kiritimatiellaeota bacterium]|nr:Gfo/Idh/MocA family oxidoreductase [Kiritimatiellota bacterium]